MTKLGATISTLDFALRALFFAIAPCCLAFAALLFPVSGALLQIGLALVVLLAGELPRNLATRSRPMRFVLSSQLAFDAYYRQHPPRPFLGMDQRGSTLKEPEQLPRGAFAAMRRAAGG